MRSLRISHKLWLAVGCIVLAQLTVVGVAGVRSARAQAESDALSREMTQRVQTATRWAGLTETNAARTLALVLSTDAVVEQAFKGDIAATSARISELQKGLEAMALTPADREQMGRIATARKAMIDLRNQARQLKDAGSHDEAVRLAQQSYVPAVATYLGTLQEFVRMQEQTAQARQAEMAATRMLTVKLAAAAAVMMLPQDGYVSFDYFVDLGMVNVKVYDLGITGISRYFSCDPIVKPHSHGNDQVSFVGFYVRAIVAVHSQHPYIQWVFGGKRRKAE